ncbi:MAG: AtzH-like domain-containing protein [Variovorax sp.]
MAYDVEALDNHFWRDARAVRFGVAENLYGHVAIAQYRRSLSSVPQRQLKNTAVLALGRNAAVVNTEFQYPGDARLGRQSQVWARYTDGWCVVAAHVSFKAGVEFPPACASGAPPAS